MKYRAVIRSSWLAPCKRIKVEKFEAVEGSELIEFTKENGEKVVYPEKKVLRIEEVDD